LAVADGATWRWVANRPSRRFYPPTVLPMSARQRDHQHPRSSARSSPVVGFAEVVEAVAMANDTIYGPIAYVFGDPAQALAVAQRIDAGMVRGQSGRAQRPAAPFAGRNSPGSAAKQLRRHPRVPRGEYSG